MILITREFLPHLIDRISGVDGHYTAFRLVFFSGFDPRSTAGQISSAILAQFDFQSPWATPWDGNSVHKQGPITTTVTASGIASYWRLVGLHGTTWTIVVHGTIGLTGSGADIKVRTLEWMIGDPLTLQVIQIFPIKLTY